MKTPLQQLFQLNKEQLLEVLRKICGTDINDDINYILNDNPKIIHKMEDCEPEEIVVCIWGKIIIDSSGIYYVPEHDPTRRIIIKFNDFFTLDKVLGELKTE
jgi:hypothetical protein